MNSKERPRGSENPFLPWERGVRDFSEKDLGFTQVVGLIGIVFLRAVIAAEWVKEGIKKLAQTIKPGGKREKPKSSPPDNGISLTTQEYKLPGIW